jgi:hypothetical protein
MNKDQLNKNGDLNNIKLNFTDKFSNSGYNTARAFSLPKINTELSPQ